MFYHIFVAFTASAGETTNYNFGFTALVDSGGGAIEFLKKMDSFSSETNEFEDIDFALLFFIKVILFCTPFTIWYCCVGMCRKCEYSYSVQYSSNGKRN